MLEKIGNFYPERAKKIIVLNAGKCFKLTLGWTFSTVWYFVKSFLPQETIDKYIFIDGYYDDIRVIFLMNSFILRENCWSILMKKTYFCTKTVTKLYLMKISY